MITSALPETHHTTKKNGNEETASVDESVTAIVQVDGKVRDRLEVSPQIAPDELEALARASDAVKRAVGEREVVNVIVRAPRVVNIATRA